MNNQEAFDLIWDYFVVRKAPFSIVGESGEEVNPLYVKDKDVRCPIGLLIAEEEYTDDIEGKSIDIVYDELPSLEGLEQEFLLVVQLSYDTHATDFATGITTEKAARTGFKNDLKRKIAKQFGIEVPKRGRRHGSVKPVRQSV